MPDGPIAIGIDSRSRGFSGAEFLARIEQLRADARFELVLVFLDCTDDVLIRRFTETRRRHPLAPDRNAADGIARERTLMFPIRAVSDLVVDTSNRSMAELKRLMTERFALDRQPGLAVTVMSFSYRIGVPREADLVFDVRFLANPHYVDALQPLDGETPEVARFIERDPALLRFPGVARRPDRALAAELRARGQKLSHDCRRMHRRKTSIGLCRQEPGGRAPSERPPGRAASSRSDPRRFRPVGTSLEKMGIKDTGMRQ